MSIFDKLKRKSADPIPQPDEPQGIPGPERIGKAQVAQAMETLQRYKKGKESINQRIIENEQWWRLRHWESIRKTQGGTFNPGDPEPASAWLQNCISNKHADAMDNYPEPNVLPREESDKQTAEALSEILPVILEQAEFESTYDSVWWYKLKTGTGVYSPVWDTRKNNGLGDIDIRKVDLLNLYWEPGVSDIQDSHNLFHVSLMTNDDLKAQYPQLRHELGSPALEIAEYVHDDTIDNSDKSVVVDWYYKIDVGGRDVLHYCKFCNDTVLFASENDPAYAESGWYAHGKYPFVFDVLFPEEATPVGYGYIDICKDPQLYIDKLNQVILKNAVMASRPRWFIRGEGAINEEEYADWRKDFVHFYSGGNPEDNIKQIEVNPLSDIYVGILTNKVEELKETSGNRDFSQGGTTAGVTAASAIAALQEAGSKLSRDMIKASYRAYAQICYFVLELVRQFYDEPRAFRILGPQGDMRFQLFSNQMMRPQQQGVEFGLDLGMRLPVFDVVVKPSKASAFSRMSQNELAKEFFGMGFFNPQLADQALACIEMMDFEGKEGVVKRISENGTLLQMVQQLQMQMLQLSQIVDAQNGTTIADGVAQSVLGGGAPMPNADAMRAAPIETNTLGAEKGREHGNVTKARERSAGGSAPR